MVTIASPAIHLIYHRVRQAMIMTTIISSSIDAHSLTDKDINRVDLTAVK